MVLPRLNALPQRSFFLLLILVYFYGRQVKAYVQMFQCYYRAPLVEKS